MCKGGAAQPPVPPAAPCTQRFWRLGRATVVSSKAWTARKAGTGTRVCIAEPIRTLALDKDALCLFTQGCSCCARSTESIKTSSVDRSLVIMSCQCWQTTAAVPNCSRESRSLKTRVKMASGRAPRRPSTPEWSDAIMSTGAVRITKICSFTI